MSTAAALWTKHRPIARAISREYRIPGLEPQDVEQEALIALWEAARAYDKSRGTFPSFARAVVHRTLTDLLRTATRAKRTPPRLRGDVEDMPAPEHNGQLTLVVDALPSLTPRERKAVADRLNGTGDAKRDQNVLAGARRKIAAALLGSIR